MTTGITDGRLRHMLGVARKMYQLSKERGHSEEEAQEMFVLGLLHDIGYEFDDGSKHDAVGGELLKRLGYRDWEEIALHGVDRGTDVTEKLMLLNLADMTVSTSGEDMTVDERVEDVGIRYGFDSRVYAESVILAERLHQFARDASE